MDVDALEYHIPKQCDCGCKNLKYNGLGEYECTRCGKLFYNEYGTVRRYVEKHRGATAPEIAKETGVPIAMINQMIKEEKFDVIDRKLKN